jgi:putative glutamine amidotransferase
VGAEVKARPLIGVTTSEVRVPDDVAPHRESDPRQTEMALGMKYMKAIERAGGIPVVMPPLDLDEVDSLLDRLDALCLSGGPDMDPGTYGGRYHPKLGPTEPELDQFELALTRGACERGMPILAICRGQQLLNVARGGNLYQHVPEEPGGDIAHRLPGKGQHGAHEVTIEPGSLLSRALGGVTEAHVNSYHHQAVHSLGRGVKPVAWAPDGLVEGIEVPDCGFAVGVQWHAEAIIEQPEQLALFQEFVAAASDYGSGAGERTRRAA